MIPEAIRGYAAGYVDGDGCIYLGKTNQKPKNITVYEYSVQIVSVKREPLDRFQIIWGGFVREKPSRIRHKDAYCWTIKGRIAAYFIQDIQVFIVDKKLQCSIFCYFSSLVHHNKFKPIEQTIIDERDNLIEKIRKDKHMNNLVTKEIIEELNILKKTKTIDPEYDYPYMAGLMDSEGCFRIKHWKPKNRPNEVYNITIEIGNTKFPILRWLIERFGGSICYIPAKTNKKASATWTLSAAALYDILPKIRPYLITKKEVCDKLIEFQQTILPNGGDRHSELFRALFEKRREIRERIIQEVNQFNLKGSH